MKIHELKLEKEYVKFLKSGAKKAEFRENDRGYQVGDVLKFYNPKKPHKKFWDLPEFKITHVLDLQERHYKMDNSGAIVKSMIKDYCVLSLKPITNHIQS